MTEKEIKENIGTIARSGTKEFLAKLKNKKSTEEVEGMIGQFGVGFYSAFIVAKKIVLITKSPFSNSAFQWESKGDGKLLYI